LFRLNYWLWMWTSFFPWPQIQIMWKQNLGVTTKDNSLEAHLQKNWHLCRKRKGKAYKILLSNVQKSFNWGRGERENLPTWGIKQLIGQKNGDRTFCTLYSYYTLSRNQCFRLRKKQRLANVQLSKIRFKYFLSGE